ncbi:MAG: hypothetical protein IPL69_19750 [Saprospiraceae bacterium]|nr:hypothetical protein [Candidatus Brachybacter algidus]
MCFDIFCKTRREEGDEPEAKHQKTNDEVLQKDQASKAIDRNCELNKYHPEEVISGALNYNGK